MLEAIVEKIPPPSGDEDAPPRALIFDSEFDQYRGVVAYVRVVDGVFTKGATVKAMQSGTEAEIDEIGFFSPDMVKSDKLEAGEVGYIITGIKELDKLRVGDTLITQARPATEALPGYREVRPVVFCGLFPIDTDKYADLRDALEKLALNDAALSYEPGDLAGARLRLPLRLPRPAAHGHRARAARARVRPGAAGDDAERGVPGRDARRRSRSRSTARPRCPTRPASKRVKEPYIRATIILPPDYVGPVMELCQDRRGTHVDMSYLSEQRVQLRYDLPLAEIVLDFYDLLKSRSRGYASLDYELSDYQKSDLVKLDILLAGDPVDALSMVVHKDKAYDAGRALATRLQKKIPRQQFEVPIQASIGSRIIARETVKPMRKDVIAKCYGGDITRKRKLLEKQKAGKKRMKQVGRVEVPQDAFLSVLELGGEK